MAEDQNFNIPFQIGPVTGPKNAAEEQIEERQEHGSPSYVESACYRRSTARRIGISEPLTLVRKLGVGGNATVWEATHPRRGRAAVKVLNRRRRGEPYQRFVREVETLRSLGEYDGVLPLLDAHLPARPASREMAWLAMPIATPIDDAPFTPRTRGYRRYALTSSSDPFMAFGTPLPAAKARRPSAATPSA